MYQLINVFFFLFHSVLVVFNTLGWIFPATRKWNLVTLGLTAGSWFILGIWYGMGYCVCTDWHWRVREKLGYHDESNSYIHFLLLKTTGINFNEQVVEIGTLVVFIISVVMSVWLNIRDWKRKKAGKFKRR